jgi:hypothetical protein
MKSYDCPRCGYHGSQKSAMVSHLNRQKVCLPILSDIDRQVALENLDVRTKKTYHCP